jgi:diamine N-acetyltransferase
MMITTRPARADDVTAILRLFRELDQLHAEALPAYFQVPDPSQLTPEELVQASTDSQQYLLLAIDYDAIVGVVFAQLEEEPAAATSIFRPRRLCWVRKLIITHLYRGRGVGRQLMQHVEQWAQQQRIGDVELLVWTFNQPALAFYEELGYVPRNIVLGKMLSPSTC